LGFAFAISTSGGIAHGQEGDQQWRFTLGGWVSFSSPAISPDGAVVYIGVDTGSGGRVIAATKEGGPLPAWGPRGRELAGQIEASPAVARASDGGIIYVGDLNGRLYALDPATGRSIWELSLSGLIVSSPALGADGTIYVGTGLGRLHAVAQNGTERWSVQTEGLIESSPAIAPDGTIYFGSHDRTLYALNPQGAVKWKFETRGEIFSSPAIGADGTIYFGSRDQRLYALAPDGSLKWEYFTNGWVDASPALGADGTIYFASDRSFYALTPGDVSARLRWRADINTGSASSAAVRADGVIIVGADDGMVRAFEPADGSIRWIFDTKGTADDLIESSPIIAPDGSIYVGSLDGHLYKLNGNGSPLSAFSSWPAFRRDTRRAARVTSGNPGGHLANIATRAQAGGSNNLVAGFVVEGVTPIPYLVRAIGPGLENVGLSGFLPDPRLDVYSGQLPLQSNDNWRPNDEFSGFSIIDTAAGVGAFPLDLGSKDASIVRPFPAGSFTAHVNSSDEAAGVALVEVYDASGGSRAGRMLNLSTRAQVGTGQNFLIAGFVVGGSGSMRLLLRGIGPGLAQFGVSGVLARPRLEVFRGPTSLATNIGWTTDGYKADLVAAAATVAAFPLDESSADCAMLFSASAGEYTIQISGVGGTTGEAMVEIYVLP
jgi:outer membrane protein assembly factor BamB